MATVMTPEKRLRTVLRGELPDRVPCVPLIYYFAASYAGVPFRDFLTSMNSYRAAYDTCFWQVGPWDAIYPLPFTMDAPDYDITWGAGVGMKPEVPSGDSDESQILQAPEAETLMEADDYAKIMGFNFPGKAYPMVRFMVELVSRFDKREPDWRFWLGSFIPHVLNLGLNWAIELERWRIKHVPMFISFSLEAPFDTFSMARGLTGFAIDLHKRGEEIRDAALKIAKSMAFAARLICVGTRNRRFLLLLHRTSNDFISPKQFELYAYPGVKYIADYLDSHGMIFGMHCDGNWDLNLEIMTDLPENTYFQFDSTTDIFRAREVLGDRFNIMGDVSADMLALAGPAEVEEYCLKLIREVGKKGRFILSSGCEVPSNAKPENVKIMIDTAKKHGWY